MSSNLKANCFVPFLRKFSWNWTYSLHILCIFTQYIHTWNSTWNISYLITQLVFFTLIPFQTQSFRFYELSSLRKLVKNSALPFVGKMLAEDWQTSFLNVLTCKQGCPCFKKQGQWSQFPCCDTTLQLAVRHILC